MLDDGYGAQVAQYLRQESYNRSAHEFLRLVQEMTRLDQKGYGDDIIIRDNGDVVIEGYYGARAIANLYRNQRPQNYYDSHYDYNRRYSNYCDQYGNYGRDRDAYNPDYYGWNGRDFYRDSRSAHQRAAEAGLIGAGVGAAIDYRNRGRGAVIGGVAGLLGSVITGRRSCF